MWTSSSDCEDEGEFAGARTAAGATIVSLVLLAGCAVGTRPFRYEAPPTVGGADREYCPALASTSAEKTYARYAAMMGIDPIGRTPGTTFGGPAFAEQELLDYYSLKEIAITRYAQIMASVASSNHQE